VGHSHRRGVHKEVRARKGRLFDHFERYLAPKLGKILHQVTSTFAIPVPDPYAPGPCLEQCIHHRSRRAAGAQHEGVHALRRRRSPLAKRREEALDVGVVGLDPLLGEAERVRGASRAGHRGRTVGERQRPELVRDRHVGAREAAGRQLTHERVEPLRLDREQLVAPVQPELLEGRVVHRRGTAVGDRPAEDSDKRGHSAYLSTS
jgi:hypothetical protein